MRVQATPSRRLQLGLTLFEARRETAMVNPLRPFLLNRQIAMEARKIAHEAIKTCKPRPSDEIPEPAITGDDDDHTKNCNALTRRITELALQVKLASMQPSMRREREGADHDDEATADTD
jgi:hypothetical protein